MMEAPDGLVADVRPRGLSEFETPKSIERQLDRVRVTAGERSNRANGEVAADHRGDLEYASVPGVQPFQSRREQGMNRRGNGDGLDIDGQSPAVCVLDENAVVREHPDEFADEQGIASGGRGEAMQQLGRQLGGAQHPGGELGRRPGIEAVEVDGVGDPAAGGDEVGPDLAQLGPGQRQHEHRHVLDPLDHMLDEIQQQAVGPLNVVECEHNWGPERQHLDEPAQRPEVLFDRARYAGREAFEVAQ
ncbi:hypothetical protein [Mycolicibacterium novocastrense]|uniref:hypothetical protein n=1 Tax=Mycolicibacterium novocastrense TaxID=59813 RepID=UPI002E25EFD1